jgi:hypothetical protein
MRGHNWPSLRFFPSLCLCDCYRISVFLHPWLLYRPSILSGGFKILLLFTVCDDCLSGSLVHWHLHWVLVRAHGLQNSPSSLWVDLSFTPCLAGPSSRTSFYTVFDSVATLLSVIIWREFVAMRFPAYVIVHVLRIGAGETMGDTDGCATSRWDVACSFRHPLSELLVVVRKTNASLWLAISPYSVNDVQQCSRIFYFFSIREY